MTPTKIKIELLKRGISQSEIAEAMSEDGGTVSGVINGRRSTIAIRIAVAKAIGRKLTDVFPDEKFRRDTGRIVKRAGFQV